MNLKEEILKFQYKEIDSVEPIDRKSLFDLVDSKETSLSSYRLMKKMYLSLDNIQNSQSALGEQLELKDEELYKLKNENFELSKELDKAIKQALAIYDLFLDIYKYIKDMHEDNWVNSLELAIKSAERKLNYLGLVRINCLGEKFNNNHHLCVGTEDLAHMETDTIIKIIKEGYFYKGKIYRPAEVIISK